MTSTHPTNQQTIRPPEVPEPASPRKASARTWVAAGAVAALVVVVGVVMMGGGGGGEADTAGMPTGNDEADAAGFGPAGAPGRGAFGEVTAVAGTTLTVESTDGSGSTTTLSVEATADTVITESLEGTVADLAVGDSVVVIGEDTEAGVATTSVVEGGTALGFGGGGPGAGGALPEGAAPEGFEPPADAQPPAEGEMPDGTDAGDRPKGAPPGGFTAGDIVATDASGLTVETEDGDQVQVTLSSSATVTVSVERSLADIAVGDTIRASGETDGSVVTAEAIQIGTGGMPGAGGGMTPGRSSGHAG